MTSIFDTLATGIASDEAAAARAPEKRAAVQIDEDPLVAGLGIGRADDVDRHAADFRMLDPDRIELFMLLGAVGVDLVVELAAFERMRDARRSFVCEKDFLKRLSASLEAAAENGIFPPTVVTVPSAST